MINDGYGNRRSLNDWTQSTDDFEYLSIPGLAKECFLEEDYTIWHEDHYRSYFWGNHILKKGVNIKAFGAAPFVYGEHLYQTIEEQKYSSIFLPRSDFSTNLKEECREILYDNLLSIDVDNPLFIAYPVDYKFWEEVIPRKNLFCIARDIFNPEWTRRLVSLYNQSKKVYFPHICSGVMYSAYMHKDISFYEEGLMYDKINDHTYSPVHKSKEWNDVMDYLKDIFSDHVLTEEKKFFTSNILSLDRIQTPCELYESLYFLCYNEKVKEFPNSLDINYNKTESLRDKSNDFSFNEVSSKALKVYSDL